MTHRLEPLEPPFPEDIAEILEKYPQSDGHILSLFRVFANSKRFLLDKGVVNLLDKNSPISLREREIVILRVCANNNCEYEWGVHVSVFATAAQLNEEQVAATKLGGATEACWETKDQLLIQAIDELCKLSKIQDSTYSEFQKHWNLEQQLEILALCGNYHTISFVANSARLDNEHFGAKFPG